AAFTIQVSGGTGGDGLTFMLLDAAAAKPTALGAGGGGMGFAGLPGVAVAFTTYGQPGDPSNNFIGVSAGGNGRNLKYLATSTNVPNLRSGTHAVQVVVGADGQSLTVVVDQAQVLQAAVQLPADRALAREVLREAWERAAAERVEVACGGGRGRTGTALACLAVLDGVPADRAVAFVRAHYDPHAVETPWQKRYVARFGTPFH